MDPAREFPWLDRYLDDVFLRSSAKHWRTTRDQLRRILASIDDLSAAALARFQSTRKAGGASHRTVNMEVSAFRAAVSWAVSVGLAPPTTWPHVRRLPYREGDRAKVRRALTAAEVGRFLAAARRLDAAGGVPQAPLWRLLIETGLRWSEATSLEPSSLQAHALRLRASNTKARRGREVPISPGLEAELRLPLRTPGGNLWVGNGTTAHRLLRRTLEEAGIPRIDNQGRSIDIHALRTTACTRLLSASVPVATVARLLGHSDPAITLRHYAALEADDVRRHLAKVWKKDEPGPPAPRE